MLRLLHVLLGLLLVIALLAVGGVLYLRTSLPQLRGELTLAGLSAPVEVLRDRHAIPHIYAQSAEDAYFALGFVHAQDRLWQMEFQRRVAAGRLAEVVGEAALATDKFLRTLSVYHYAERVFDNLSPQAQGVLLAYADGVNAYLRTRRGLLPPEFLILRHQPEPWRPADSLAWLTMMAWDLGGNWDDELLRARLSLRLNNEQLAALWPPYPGDAPIALPDFRALYRELPLDALWAASPKPLPPGAGSNNWVVDGSRSITGMPLLANDPHLSLQAPSLWYLAHLSAPGLNVIGATLPGLPLVILGRTDRIAWGFTNTGPDVQDLFIERLDSEDPGRYQTPDGFEPFTTRREVIRVRDGDEVVLTVRQSRHGPIISDVVGRAAEIAGTDYVLALAWTALREDNLTFQAGLNLNHARNWDEFVAALRDYHAPQQNIVYADIEGNIGFYAPGRVPIRAAGDGLMPVPGWSGEYDWVGFIPFEALPHAFNLEAGVVITANHKIVPDDYPYFLTHDWAEPYRAERITELLAQLERHSLETFARIQADQRSLMAVEFLPLLLAVRPETELARQAIGSLVAWDGTMDRDRAEPLIVAAWYREFTRLVYQDELGELFYDAWEFRPLFIRQVLRQEQGWCDDIRTTALESCEYLAARALELALEQLSRQHGDDLTRWRWGAAHVALNAHAIMTGTPLARLFDLAIANGGDAFTVNAARFSIRGPGFTQTSGATFRALYDLADLDRSLFIHTTGQSGNPLSRFYRHLVEPWRDVQYLPMTTRRTDSEVGALGTLRLLPGR
ncbi:MAG: penicillin acylase family protein [Truepera sp.]|nr:penicillin acylase family protein [Truepera sp.]